MYSFCTADIACAPRIVGFDTVGACLPLHAGFRTAHTLSTHSMWTFSVLGVLSVLAACTPRLSVLGLRNVLGTPSIGSIYL